MLFIIWPRLSMVIATSCLLFSLPKFFSSPRIVVVTCGFRGLVLGMYDRYQCMCSPECFTRYCSCVEISSLIVGRGFEICVLPSSNM
ncbi:hypothetical protein F4775DRAFT_536117 [Biscogniauxia sp. FL1348]|nr:hypothetical protein F4775DRAFT_536117 [Biscogniauxia sp. FL1348]